MALMEMVDEEPLTSTVEVDEIYVGGKYDKGASASGGTRSQFSGWWNLMAARDGARPWQPTMFGKVAEIQEVYRREPNRAG
jgi:hypothetical protein